MDLITTAQLLGNFGEFVGAIAVVATLGYLAYQIRQNTIVARSSIRQGITQMYVNQIADVVVNRDLAKIFTDSTLGNPSLRKPTCGWWQEQIKTVSSILSTLRLSVPL